MCVLVFYGRWKEGGGQAYSASHQKGMHAYIRCILITFTLFYLPHGEMEDAGQGEVGRLVHAKRLREGEGGVPPCIDGGGEMRVFGWLGIGVLV